METDMCCAVVPSGSLYTASVGWLIMGEGYSFNRRRVLRWGGRFCVHHIIRRSTPSTWVTTIYAHAVFSCSATSNWFLDRFRHVIMYISTTTMVFDDQNLSEVPSYSPDWREIRWCLLDVPPVSVTPRQGPVSDKLY